MSGAATAVKTAAKMARRAALWLGLAALAASCVGGPGAPNPWDADATRASLGVAPDDAWCGHMRALRAALDGAGPAPTKAERDAALAGVRAEADAKKGGDKLWPFRKALICEYVDGAAEERVEFDWVTAADFLALAREAAVAPPPADGMSPLVPVFDHLDGGEPVSLEPVDLSDPAYCDALATSELALSQQRGGVVEAVGFPGSQQRAPDWFAMAQVAYHRWAHEQLEGHQLAPGPVDFGGIPFHCRRFHAALEGSKAFAIKDNLIFLLAERDDPTRAGRLEVRDALGNLIVLDDVLAAAQADADGADAEKVDFYREDLNASPSLKRAVDRSNNLPPPAVFQILLDTNETSPVEHDPQLGLLRAELATRGPQDTLRIALAGHADCVGPSGFNQVLSERRARAVLNEVVLPALRESGFSEAALADDLAFKLAGLGETAPTVKDAPRCVATDADRRVVVIVQ